MGSLIDRIQERTTTTSQRTRIVDMAEEDADEVLDALTSNTGRRTFRALFDEPATTSELAERLDTSIQNVHHHLSNLRDAGLVESVDTIYSEKGNEMTVYGPASDPLVFVGDGDRLPRVEHSLREVVTGLGLLAAASLLVQWATERLLRPGDPRAVDIGPASHRPMDPTAPGVVQFVFETAEPGLLFFVGCLAVIGIVAWYGGR